MEYEFLLVIAKLVNGTNFSLVAFLPEFFQWVVLKEKKWRFLNLISPL